MNQILTRVGDYTISTVYIPALKYYETMVFAPKSANPWQELDMQRYDTEENAIIGHEYMIYRWSSK